MPSQRWSDAGAAFDIASQWHMIENLGYASFSRSRRWVMTVAAQCAKCESAMLFSLRDEAEQRSRSFCIPLCGVRVAYRVGRSVTVWANRVSLSAFGNDDLRLLPHVSAPTAFERLSRYRAIVFRSATSWSNVRRTHFVLLISHLLQDVKRSRQ